MKRVRAFFSMLLILGLVVCSFPISKAAGSDWNISNVNSSHTGITFDISNYDGTSSAYVVVMTRDEKEVSRTPVTISENGSVTANPQSGINAGFYYWYIEDSSGEKSKKRDLTIDKHSYYVTDGHAYSELFVAKKSMKADFQLYVIIGSNEYKATLEGDLFTAKYPTQSIGTKIKIKCTDGYGCDEFFNYEVQNKELTLPPMDVFFGYAKISYNTGNLSEDERICANVNGVDYFGKYGATYTEKAVEYSDDLKKGDKVTLWVESKLGGSSKKNEYEIRDCDLKKCEYSVVVGDKRAYGTVTKNEDGRLPSDVSITVNGKDYHATVDSDGNFDLTYPSLNGAFSVSLLFSDKHGCSYEESFVNHGTSNIKNSDIIVTREFASAVVGKGERVCATLSSNKETYYSEYCASDSGEVRAVFPKSNEEDDVSVWIEDETGNTSKKEKYSPSDTYRTYPRFTVTTVSIDGKKVKDDDDIDDLYPVRYKSVYVMIGEKQYDGTINESTGEFKIEYDKQSLDTKLTLYRVYEKQGDYKDEPVIVTTTKDFYINNVPPKFKVKDIASDTQMVVGTTAANSSITLTASGKKYSAKSDASGSFKLKIKKQKSGKVLEFKVTCEDGMFGYYYKRVLQAEGYVSIVGYVLQSSKQVKVKLKGAERGNEVVLKIGGRKYSKKIKSKKKTIVFSVNGLKTWQKITVDLLDSFGKKKDHCVERVYYSNGVKVGMSADYAQKTIWGPPVRKHNWGFGSLQWVFEFGGTTYWVYIVGGKVSRIQY